MTPVERRAAIDAIGWSVAEVARRTGRTPRTVRGWLLGQWQPPDEVDTWLAQVAQDVAAHPGPEWGTENEEHAQKRKPPTRPEAPEPRRSVWIGRV